MNRIFFSALLLCAAAAGAQEAPKQPVADTPQSPEIRQVMNNLSTLLERGPEIPRERMNALAPELTKFNAKLRDTIGEKILAEIAAREKAAADEERTETALNTLRAFRGALQVYYAETGGKYPKSPAELTPKYFTAVPELHLPDHQKSAKVTVIDSRKYDKDMSKAVTDSGGWLYFSNPDSTSYGLLLLDSSRIAPEGVAFFEY